MSVSNTVAGRAADRAVAAQRQRAEQEVRVLVDAGLALLRRRGAAGMTVADVLAEANLSTRAFYRHFASKDELLLAVYEHEARRNHAALREALAAAATPRDAVETWIDAMLGLAFDTRRARRTSVLFREGARLRSQFPAEFAAILAGAIEPLSETLEHIPGADPRRDALSIHAVVWALVEERLRGDVLTRDVATAHAQRFCLRAIGVSE
jgi:AcrR family transcriptional regulator